MIITGVEYCGDIIALLGSGAEHGCSFTYRVQDQPDGIAGALKLCEDFVGNDKCVVLLGDNIFKKTTQHINTFQDSDMDYVSIFKHVDNPSRYGVGVFHKDSIIEIEEKPKSSNLLVSVFIFILTKYLILSKMLKNLIVENRNYKHKQ